MPITFLDKYNPNQFQILGITQTWDGGASQTYPKQTQINKDGKKSEVTKLNDGPAIKVDSPPVNQTYYMIGENVYIKLYARVLIRRRVKN